jgi:hypothetical protein
LREGAGEQSREELPFEDSVREVLPQPREWLPELAQAAKLAMQHRGTKKLAAWRRQRLAEGTAEQPLELSALAVAQEEAKQVLAAEEESPVSRRRSAVPARRPEAARPL